MVDPVERHDQFVDKRLVLFPFGIPRRSGWDERLCQTKVSRPSAQQFAGDDDGVHHTDATRAEHRLDR